MSKVQLARKCAVIQNKDPITDFIRDTAATDDFSGGSRQIYFMRRRKGGGWSPRLISWFRHSEDIEQIVNDLEFRKNGFYTITKNSFYADYHHESALFSIDNVVIDCDCHGTELSDIEYQYECGRLIYALENDGKGRIPAFSVTYSGQGLHFWIRLQSFSAKLLPRYRDIVRILCANFQRVCKDIDSVFNVDEKASGNPAGLIRLGNTRNHDAGRYAVYEHRTDKRYDLDELQEFTAISINFDTGKVVERKFGDRTANPSDLSARYMPLNKKRLHYIETLVNLKPNQTGRREILVFLYANAAYSISGDEEQAKKAAMKINRMFSDPLSRSEVVNAVKGIVKKGGYEFITKAGFFALIGADCVERYLYDNLTSRRDEERKERRAAKAERDAEIMRLHSQGMKQADIAALTSCTQQTVSNVIKRNFKESPIP